MLAEHPIDLIKKFQMKTESLVPATHNISRAWAEVFLRLTERGMTELSPVVVTVDELNGEKPVECESIRALLDAHLTCLGLQSCHTVANTIFPESLWNSTEPASQLFERYDRMWPQLKKCPANNLGTYFRRMSDFQPRGCPESVKQLKHVIETYKGGNHRRSALQVSIFDPTRDHKNTRRLKFPCLHQVGFLPSDGELTITAYYAKQFVVERAYGNYLGLCRLGRFMASQMGLRFARMVCVASIAELGVTKTKVRSLADEIQKVMDTDHGN